MSQIIPRIALDNGLDIGKLTTTGSTLQINEDYNEVETIVERHKLDKNGNDIVGEPVESFDRLQQQLTPIHDAGYVKKKIIDKGGGLQIAKDCTISVIYSGYFEGDQEPFDATSNKPLVINLQDSGLLPGLQIAIESMLVGETSIFLLSYNVMYGELGIPPRIKPKADCVFYIRLIKSVLIPPIVFSEENTFNRVHKEIKMLYASGEVLYKSKNYSGAIQVFRKAVNMWYKSRLADEQEELIQSKSLVKLYTNLAICYNLTKQPLKACIACNELNRLNRLWNNGKVLFQNAKALRMIGQLDEAERRLKRATKLIIDKNGEIQAELKLIEKSRNILNETKNTEDAMTSVSDCFKEEINSLINEYKESSDLYNITLPSGLSDAEIEYIQEVCLKENLAFNKFEQCYLLDKDETALEAEATDLLARANLL